MSTAIKACIFITLIECVWGQKSGQRRGVWGQKSDKRRFAWGQKSDQWGVVWGQKSDQKRWV